MNTRLIAIISSIAVLSSATSSTETVTSSTPVPGKGGLTFSVVSSTSQTTLNPNSMPSTSTTSHTANPSKSPQVSIDPTLVPTISVTTSDKTTNTPKPNNSRDNNMNKTTTHSSNINSSSALEENTTQGPSGTTDAPVTVHHTTIETSTKIKCNCSEYVTTSPPTKKPQTSTKLPNITTAPSTSNALPPITTTPPANLSPSSTTNASSPISTAPTTSKAQSPNHKAPSTITTASTTLKVQSPNPTVPLIITTAPTTPKAQSPNHKAPSIITTASTTPKVQSPNLTVPSTITTALTTPKAQSPNLPVPSTITTASTTPKAQSPNPTVPSTITTASTTPKAQSPNLTVPSTITTASTIPTAQSPNPTVSSTITTGSTTPKAKLSNPTAQSTITTTQTTITTTPTTPKAQSPTPTAPTTPKVHLSTTTAIPLTSSQTPPSAIPNKRRRRGFVNVEIDEIQSKDINGVYDDTSSYDLYCMDWCNITIKETTTDRPTTTTPKPTTTTPRHRSIDLSGKLVDLNLVIVVMGNFTQDLTNHSSKNYTNLAKLYNTSLHQFYSHLLQAKFKKIVILGFSKGSIKCNYSLEMNAPINESNANSTFQILRNVNWKTDSLANLILDVNKTATAQAVLLSNDLVFLPANVCGNNEDLEWDDDGNPICKYKCDSPVYKGKCGDHGECSFTYGGVFRCICKDGYSGNECETPTPLTTTAKPIKPDAIALSKIDIIGIAGGIGGGLVLILLVALCCVYTKLNKAKKRDRFYGYMDNDKEFLHDENSRIENVPDLKNEYTNLGYQREQDELQMQRFEPEGKNVDYEPGQPQGAYERDDKAYRKVEEPEGGNVLIYQPKHLNGPMERQSGASKFDEVEERSNPYRMMDTDTTYKIRRPTVNSDRNVPYN